MRTRHTPALGKYIGRPYEEYNCLDLVKDFYKTEFNIEVKNYYEGDVPDPKNVESLIVASKGDFVPATMLKKGPRFGDIVTIRLYGIECHLGVCVGDGYFLHSTKNIGSHADRLDRYKNMIAGYLRHRDNDIT